MISDGKLRERLADSSGLAHPTIEVHNGGMNSATWFITAGHRRWVAEAVPPVSRRAFAGGLAIAAALEQAGIPAGAPAPTRRGDVAAAVAAYDQLGPHTLSGGLLHTDPAPRGVPARSRFGGLRCARLEHGHGRPAAVRPGLGRHVRRRAGTRRLPDRGVSGPGGIPPAEAERALGAMLRFRWAVQADYFARRIAAGI